MTRLLLYACGIFFVIWCAIAIFFPVYKVMDGTLEMSGDFLAIIILHLVMGAGVLVVMRNGMRRKPAAPAPPAA